MEHLGSLNEANLKHLSHKLATLLALVTGGRLQTISLIRLSKMKQDPQCIQIFITDFIKTSMVSRVQPCLNLPFFPENEKICSATTIMEYIEATKNLRGNEDFLFVTHSGAHKRASKQTISRWVRETLRNSGIDTSHSTRHASTSAAFRAGTSVEIICRTAGWSQNTATFAKHYNRPLHDVLNQNFKRNEGQSASGRGVRRAISSLWKCVHAAYTRGVLHSKYLRNGCFI